MARRREDLRPDEQSAEEDDPEHRPGGEEPGLRDHTSAIGSPPAGVERSMGDRQVAGGGWLE